MCACVDVLFTTVLGTLLLLYAYFVKYKNDPTIERTRDARAYKTIFVSIDPTRKPHAYDNRPSFSRVRRLIVLGRRLIRSVFEMKIRKTRTERARCDVFIITRTLAGYADKKYTEYQRVVLVKRSETAGHHAERPVVCAERTN